VASCHIRRKAPSCFGHRIRVKALPPSALNQCSFWDYADIYVDATIVRQYSSPYPTA